MTNVIGIATLIGSFPCIAMLFASFLLVNFKVTTQTEAIFQNFAAGLILAAGALCFYSF